MRIAAAFALLTLAACDDSSPCDDYVTYMCDCHPEKSCSDLETVYGGADTSLDDECAVALDDQEQADAEAGLTCGSTSTGDSGA